MASIAAVAAPWFDHAELMGGGRRSKTVRRRTRRMTTLERLKRQESTHCGVWNLSPPPGLALKAMAPAPADQPTSDSAHKDAAIQTEDVHEMSKDSQEHIVRLQRDREAKRTAEAEETAPRKNLWPQRGRKASRKLPPLAPLEPEAEAATYHAVEEQQRLQGIVNQLTKSGPTVADEDEKTYELARGLGCVAGTVEVVDHEALNSVDWFLDQLEHRGEISLSWLAQHWALHGKMMEILNVGTDNSVLEIRKGRVRLISPLALHSGHESLQSGGRHCSDLPCLDQPSLC